MTWSSPMTAVAGAVFTAAQFNQYVRDNLNMTCPSLATAAGQIMVSDAPNEMAVRTPATAAVATSDTTTSTSYTPTLTSTSGPSLTCFTGTQAYVSLYCANENSGATSSLMGFAVSGASSVSASDPFSIGGAFGSAGGRVGATWLVTGLTAGSNTFTANYRVGSGTGTFVNRTISVIPL